MIFMAKYVINSSAQTRALSAVWDMKFHRTPIP